ncbi:glycosyltransferase [Roseateles sp. BYS78W]|uniref:Glycosyltransferase n=1 Tax=Pelomonas candidula TaxID=3299025 RepID=A0ABW7H886_9BURK
MPAPDRPLRIALFAEAVTLAHVARPIALARAIAPAGHELLLACDPRYAAFTADGPWQREDMRSIPSAQFNEALAKGKPVYDFDTLNAYVTEDLHLLEGFKPDLVIGDFRLSLSVSARLAGIPYMAITNAYWTPQYEGGYALPVIPLSRVLPLPLASALFHTFRPLAFIPHCQPMNRLRRHHKLPPLGNNLRRVYTDADHLLIPDLKPLYPMSGASDTHSYIGPLMWSPSVAPPSWWDEPVDESLGSAYVTLGSSGNASLLPMILEALKDMPVRALASTAGAAAPPDTPTNARLASYLPGDAAALRSRLVICNGGSLSTQQALAAGVPILGIASNMDQFLNMAPIEAAGAGIVLRADRLSKSAIRQAAERLLRSEAAANAARGFQQPLLAAARGVGAAFDKAATRLLASHP